MILAISPHARSTAVQIIQNKHVELQEMVFGCDDTTARMWQMPQAEGNNTWVDIMLLVITPPLSVICRAKIPPKCNTRA